jgi:hypothetical protein
MADVSPEFEPTTAERIARNDALFREANERIRESAEEYGVDTVPFICECADPTCRTVIRMALDEYRAIREHPRWFLNVPGHEVSAKGFATPVRDGDGYRVVEKIGIAGEIVEELDERVEEGAG